MKNFFKNVSRETLAGDYMPESEPSVEEQQQGGSAANSTEEQDQGYPTSQIQIKRCWRDNVGIRWRQ